MKVKFLMLALAFATVLYIQFYVDLEHLLSGGLITSEEEPAPEAELVTAP